MKITKYEHSCLVLEQDNKRLIIDPGVVTKTLKDYSNTVAILVTHVHADHFDLSNIRKILAQNPNAPLYTVPAVAGELPVDIKPIIVSGGQKLEVGPFNLEFAGGEHAIIHKDTPTTDNVGVTVNNKFYYSGDSLSIPHAPIEILAVPITAPWLKISDAMDFIATIKPKQIFAVHDALLSEFGMEVNNRWLQIASDKVGAKYIVLKPGESLSV